MSYIVIDPEFRDLIPPLQADERAQLQDNILADGCRDPLVLWGDILLDGHNRYEICREHGIEFEKVQLNTIKSRDDAVMWIIKHQLGRRNITDFVRVELALRAKPIIESRAKANQEGGVPLKSAEGLETRKVIAKSAGVGKDTVRNVEKIKAGASREVLDRVRSGEVSISAAAKVSSLPKHQQEKALYKPAPAKVEEEPEESFGPSEDELRSNDEDTAEELASLRRIAESDDRIAAAMAEVKRYREDNRVLRERRDGLMNQCNEQIKMIKSLQRKLQATERVAA